jgi:hypothetical protein
MALDYCRVITSLALWLRYLQKYASRYYTLLERDSQFLRAEFGARQQLVARERERERERQRVLDWCRRYEPESLSTNKQHTTLW